MTSHWKVLLLRSGPSTVPRTAPPRNSGSLAPLPTSSNWKPNSSFSCCSYRTRSKRSWVPCWSWSSSASASTRGRRRLKRAPRRSEPRTRRSATTFPASYWPASTPVSSLWRHSSVEKRRPRPSRWSWRAAPGTCSSATPPRLWRHCRVSNQRREKVGSRNRTRCLSGRSISAWGEDGWGIEGESPKCCCRPEFLCFFKSCFWYYLQFYYLFNLQHTLCLIPSNFTISLKFLALFIFS